MKMVGTARFELATSRAPSVNWMSAANYDGLLQRSVFFVFFREQSGRRMRSEQRFRAME